MKGINPVRISILLLTALLGLSGCEKNPASTTAPVVAGQPPQVLARIGVQIDDAAGTVTVTVDGQQLQLTPANGGLRVTSDIINDKVSLLDIRYTPLGCSGFANPGGNVRTISLTFKNITLLETLPTIIPVNFTGTNLDGGFGTVDVNNGVEPDEEFTIDYQVILTTCATFSFFFDLADGV